MGGRSSIPLVRVFGIRIGVSPSWFFVLFALIYVLTGNFQDVLDERGTTPFLVAVAGAILFFGSIILHELGHALVARRLGIGITGIDLWFFGGIANMSRDADSPGEEFKVAVAGPVVTALIIGLCVGVSAALSKLGAFSDAARFDATKVSPAIALIGWLATINFALLVFNLVPAFPLDGGRITRAAAWRLTGDRNRGTRFSGRLGVLFGYALMAAGLYFALADDDPFDGLITASLGWILLQAAQGAVAGANFSERIDGVTVTDLMDPQPVSLPGELTVLRAIDEFFHRYGWNWFPVVDAAGRYLGILSQERADGAITAGQPALEVREVLDPAGEDDLKVASDTPLERLLTSRALAASGALMVVDPADGRLCGVVTLEQVRRALAAATSAR